MGLDVSCTEEKMGSICRLGSSLGNTRSRSAYGGSARISPALVPLPSIYRPIVFRMRQHESVASARTRRLVPFASRQRSSFALFYLVGLSGFFRRQNALAPSLERGYRPFPLCSSPQSAVERSSLPSSLTATFSIVTISPQSMRRNNHDTTLERSGEVPIFFPWGDQNGSSPRQKKKKTSQ